MRNRASIVPRNDDLRVVSVSACHSHPRTLTSRRRGAPQSGRSGGTARGHREPPSAHARSRLRRETEPLNGCPVVDRAATQRRDAAYRELHEKGYGDTTIAGVAEAVGVSVQTIYKSFGSKATLAKRVYDVTLVGDEDSIPLAERPAIQAIIAEPEPRRKLAMYAALGRKLIERSRSLGARAAFARKVG